MSTIIRTLALFVTIFSFTAVLNSASASHGGHGGNGHGKKKCHKEVRRCDHRHSNDGRRYCKKEDYHRHDNGCCERRYERTYRYPRKPRVIIDPGVIVIGG